MNKLSNQVRCFAQKTGLIATVKYVSRVWHTATFLRHESNFLTRLTDKSATDYLLKAAAFSKTVANPNSWLKTNGDLSLIQTFESNTSTTTTITEELFKLTQNRNTNETFEALEAKIFAKSKAKILTFFEQPQHAETATKRLVQHMLMDVLKSNPEVLDEIPEQRTANIKAQLIERLNEFVNSIKNSNNAELKSAMQPLINEIDKIKPNDDNDELKKKLIADANSVKNSTNAEFAATMQAFIDDFNQIKSNDDKDKSLHNIITSCADSLKDDEENAKQLTEYHLEAIINEISTGMVRDVDYNLSSQALAEKIILGGEKQYPELIEQMYSDFKASTPDPFFSIRQYAYLNGSPEARRFRGELRRFIGLKGSGLNDLSANLKAKHSLRNHNINISATLCNKLFAPIKKFLHAQSYRGDKTCVASYKTEKRQARTKAYLEALNQVIKPGGLSSTAINSNPASKAHIIMQLLLRNRHWLSVYIALQARSSGDFETWNNEAKAKIKAEKVAYVTNKLKEKILHAYDQQFLSAFSNTTPNNASQGADKTLQKALMVSRKTRVVVYGLHRIGSRIKAHALTAIPVASTAVSSMVAIAVYHALAVGAAAVCLPLSLSAAGAYFGFLGFSLGRELHCDKKRAQYMAAEYAEYINTPSEEAEEAPEEAFFDVEKAFPKKQPPMKII